MKEEIWPLFDKCVKVTGLPDHYKYVLSFCYPRKVFSEHCSTFAHVNSDWSKIAKIYFRILAEIAIKKPKKIRVFLEGVRSEQRDGPISDYVFHALIKEGKALEPNDILDRMLKIAVSVMTQKRIKPDEWMKIGSYGNREWMRLYGVYSGMYNDKEERASLKDNANPENPACAIKFFSFSNAFCNRTPGYWIEQGIGNYFHLDAELNPLNQFSCPDPTTIYELSMEDIVMEKLDSRILPEIQSKQLSAEGSILEASINLLKRIDNKTEEANVEMAERLAHIDSIVLGESISPTKFLAPKRPEKISHPVGQSSIYTLIGRESTTTMSYIDEIYRGRNEFGRLCNPLEAARKLYLEHQDIVFDKYRTLCRGNFENLSPSGRIMVDYIKNGGVDKRKEILCSVDPLLTPWANDQCRKLRGYVGVFKATEPSAALINQIRNYMLDAFIIDLNRVHLNMMLNSTFGAKSKSFCTRVAASSFPDGIVKILSYFSDKAFFTSEMGPNQNGFIGILDDTNAQMFDKNSANSQDSTLKFIMSTCTVCCLRNVEDKETGGRKREEVFAEICHCLISCGNHEWLRCKLIGDALKTREHIIEVDEGIRAVSEVQDMINKDLIEGKSPSSPQAIALRNQLWAESALFFEAASLIACGALRTPTTFIAGVTLEYLRYWFEKNQYPCDQIRDSGRLVSLATIKCIQDGIHRLFFAKGGLHTDKEYDINQMKDLDPLLYISVQHMVSAIGEQADLLYNRHEKAILGALTVVLGEQNSLRWVGENDYSYMRFVIRGSASVDFTDSRAMSLAPLGEDVKRIIKEENKEGEIVPTVDCICDYLDSICQRTAKCRTWTTILDHATTTSIPHGSVGKFVDRDNSKEKARPLAQVLTSVSGKYFIIQTDYMKAEKNQKHTEILKEALEQFLSVAHQKKKKLIFCPNPVHLSIYEVIHSGAKKDAEEMQVKIAAPVGENDIKLQGLAQSDEEKEYMTIDKDLDVMAMERRNKKLYVGKKAVKRNGMVTIDEIEDEKVFKFFRTLIPRGTLFKTPEDLLKELDYVGEELEDLEWMAPWSQKPQGEEEILYPEKLLEEIERPKKRKRKRISFGTKKKKV